MRIGYLLSFLTLCSSLLLTHPVKACQYAQQHRLIPLGLHKGQLVALELAVFRGNIQHREFAPTRWKGMAWLRYIDKQGRILPHKKRFSRVWIKSSDYTKQLRQLVKRALATLKVRKAKRIDTHDCAFSLKCNGYRMVSQKTKVPKNQASWHIIHHRHNKSFRIGKGYLKHLAGRQLKTSVLRFSLQPTNRLVAMQVYTFSASERFVLMQVSRKQPKIPSSKQKVRVCRNVMACLLHPRANHHGASIDFIGKL